MGGAMPSCPSPLSTYMLSDCDKSKSTKKLSHTTISSKGSFCSVLSDIQWIHQGFFKAFCSSVRSHHSIGEHTEKASKKY
mmetsp:Transcript_40445/g.95025  ORF Transcript_40445/g.95025 Transcript_40445/m.95025 type:complete len:80 (-) Transcript_40445:748-987(-)